MAVLSRGLEPVIENAWRTTPVVILEGPRSVGKTTLARAIVGSQRFHDLLDERELELARQSPRAWLETMAPRSVIDEAQLVPNIALAVKQKVDRAGPHPGQLMLTGSIRMRNDELGGSDPLVGRARRLRLLPFAQCELAGEPRDVVTELFNGNPVAWNLVPTTQPEMFDRMSRGGYPIWQKTENGRDRRLLLDEYVEGLFSGDIHTTSRSSSGILRLFWWLAASSGALRNLSKFVQAVEIAPDTARAYLDELSRVYLLSAIPAWHPHPDRRETDKPRLVVIDPAFCAAAFELSEHVGPASPVHGPVFETFVATELQRLAAWSSTDVDLYHWRRNDHDEVDLLLEDRKTGRLIGFEIKASREAPGSYFHGLEAFKQRYPKQFHRGFVIHSGDHQLRHSDDMWSVPFSALWSIGEAMVTPMSTKRSLSDALAAAKTEIKGSGGFVEPPEIEQWTEALLETHADVVVPQLREIEVLLSDLGFQCELDLAKPPTGRPATVARGEAGIVTATTYLRIRENRQSASDVGWSVECRSTLRANGQVEWLVVNAVGREQQNFGGPFVADWDSNIESELNDKLVRLADLLQWSIVEFRMPPNR